MAFTAADVKTLREMTGVGMMDCKKALAEADANAVLEGKQGEQVEEKAEDAE